MMRALGRPSKWFFLLEAALPRLETRKVARSEIERRIRQVAEILQIADPLERKPS